MLPFVRLSKARRISCTELVCATDTRNRETTGHTKELLEPSSSTASWNLKVLLRAGSSMLSVLRWHLLDQFAPQTLPILSLLSVPQHMLNKQDGNLFNHFSCQLTISKSRSCADDPTLSTSRRCTSELHCFQTFSEC